MNAMYAMTRMKSAALPLVFVSALSAQTSTPAWELANPNAKILVGIDVRGLRESEVGKSFSARMDAKGSPTPALPFRVPGMELLTDIDSVFLSSTGEIPKTTPAKPGASSQAAASKNPPFLIVLKGTFPDEHLRPLLAGKHPSYKAVNIYGASGAGSGNLAVLDEHTVIFGDEKSIHFAIDRKGTAVAHALSPAFVRAQELAASNDVWVVAKDTASSLQQAAGANPFASEVDGLEIGMRLREGLGLDVNLATKSEAAAGMLAQMLTSEIESAVAKKADDPQVAELVHKLHVGSQGNLMTVHLALTQEEMQRSIELTRAARMNAGKTRTEGVSTASAAPPPAQPAGPRKVRIYGLDEGVREITLEPRR